MTAFLAVKTVTPEYCFMSTTTKQRFRSRGTIGVTTQCEEESIHTFAGHNYWAHNSWGPAISTGEFETMRDVVVKDFRKQQRKGKTFFNDCEREKTSLIDNGGTGCVIKALTPIPGTTEYPEYRLNGNWMAGMVPQRTLNGLSVPVTNGLYTESEIQRLVDEVSTSMLAQRGKSDSNLWETLAEMDQTLDMFDKPFSRLGSVLKKADKAKREGKSLGYALNGMSNLWLAYRYGIMPLVRDIQGIAEILRKKAEKLDRKTTRSRHRVSDTKEELLDTYLGVTKLTVRKETFHSVYVRAMSLDSVDWTLANQLGFTGKGLVTLPWELVRYSFVADWLGNFGDFIGAYVPAFGFTQLGSCVSINQTVRTVFTAIDSSLVAPYPSYYSLTSPYQGQYVVAEVKYKRKPLTSPRLLIRNDFGFGRVTRVADAAALFQQQIKRIFR